MDFQLSEEQQMIQDSVRRFCESDYEFEQRRKLHDSAEGFSRAHWGTFAELGCRASNVNPWPNRRRIRAVDSMRLPGALFPRPWQHGPRLDDQSRIPTASPP